MRISELPFLSPTILPVRSQPSRNIVSPGPTFARQTNADSPAEYRSTAIAFPATKLVDIILSKGLPLSS